MDIPRSTDCPPSVRYMVQIYETRMHGLSLDNSQFFSMLKKPVVFLCNLELIKTFTIEDSNENLRLRFQGGALKNDKFCVETIMILSSIMPAF